MSIFHILDGFKPYVFTRPWQRIPNPLTNIPGVYCITVIESGMVYIGSTAALAGRMSQNLTTLQQGRHCNSNMQSAYSADNELEFMVRPTATIKEAQLLEQHLVDEFKDSGYLCNRSVIDVTRPSYGIKVTHTIDHQRKMTAGIRKYWENDSSRQQRSRSLKAFYETEQSLKSLETRSRPITIDGVTYPSISEASRILQKSRLTLRRLK